MDIATFLAFVIFVCIMTGTPGPGNLTFLAIGSSQGFRAALPIIVAAQIGNVFVNLLIAFGFGALIQGGTIFQTIFTYASLGYMMYLAHRIIMMSLKRGQNVNPPSFWQGIFIHPLSPKTWAMGVSAYGLYFIDSSLGMWQKASFLVFGFMIGGFVFHSLWAIAGESLLRLIGEGFIMRVVTVSLAVLMVGVTIWSLFS